MENINYSAIDIQNLIDSTWKTALRKPGVFRYQLQINKDEERILKGRMGFLLQLNPNRTNLRRRPQSIHSLRPDFVQEAFNFKKTTRGERLFEILYKKHDIHFIVNNSPLTKNHCLICPDLKAQLPQVLNSVALEFPIALLAKLQNRRLRIGYNSPGALASVNNLHLHLIDLGVELFPEKMALKTFAGQWQTFKDPFPCVVLVYVVPFKDDIEIAAREIMRIITYLCDNGYPHNVIFTNGENSVRVLIFLRDNRSLTKEKELTGFNIGCFELCGYVVVGNQEQFNNLTEDHILKRIEEEMIIQNVNDLLTNLKNVIKEEKELH